ncbi:MAG: DUF4411 domain-containing protein [Alphaproteobacteria bacterium HGW-Alphaproteobacteria-12]|nr:MAG: DUF4411 domain-containing protein [Alphaproteobacteria bacterium HGW-Alphaproteobacteria-12]
MIFLLDADTLITGNRQSYPIQRFPIFWDWLLHQGTLGLVKIPTEQFEEVTSGRGNLVDWLSAEETKEALLLREEADKSLVARVTLEGYGDLNEDEIETVGRDPFLVSYGLADLAQRTVVTFEVSAPAKQRANRKVPDVCAHFGVPSCNLFKLIDVLDFTTGWQRPVG